MKDFVSKIDNNPTSSGVVVAEEYNSFLNELKNTVKPYITLDGQDDKQLSKSIDIASKALYYSDIGTVNNVILTRAATSDQIENLVDGMVVIFSVANVNTGASTLKLHALATKTMLFNGLPLTAGVLRLGVNYIAIYQLSADSFNIDLLTGVMAGSPDKITGYDQFGIPTDYELPLGVGQTWKTTNYTVNTDHYNTSGRAIYVIIGGALGSSGGVNYSINGKNMFNEAAVGFIVPNGDYFRFPSVYRQIELS